MREIYNYEEKVKEFNRENGTEFQNLKELVEGLHGTHSISDIGRMLKLRNDTLRVKLNRDGIAYTTTKWHFFHDKMKAAKSFGYNSWESAVKGLYVDHGKSLRETADALGVTAYSIKYVLDGEGVGCRPRGGANSRMENRKAVRE